MKNPAKRYLSLLTVLPLLLAFLPVQNVLAVNSEPNLYFKTTAESFAPDSEITVGVFIGSVPPVNAFNIEIGYSVQTLEFLGFNSNFSVVDFWQGDPEAFADGIIKIEGGISKSFSGNAGELIKLNFRTKENGRAQWSFRKADIYYADGFGTLAKSEVLPMSLVISPDGVRNKFSEKDLSSPEILGIQIAKNPADGGRLAVFRATDTGSGLKAVYLRLRKWLLWGEWQRAVNPMKLSAGVWSFQIKAIDNQGNASVETVYLKNELIKKLAYLMLGLIVIAVILRFLMPKIKKSKKKML